MLCQFKRCCAHVRTCIRICNVAFDVSCTINEHETHVEKEEKKFTFTLHDPVKFLSQLKYAFERGNLAAPMYNIRELGRHVGSAAGNANSSKLSKQKYVMRLHVNGWHHRCINLSSSLEVCDALVNVAHSR